MESIIHALVENDQEKISNEVLELIARALGLGALIPFLRTSKASMLKFVSAREIMEEIGKRLQSLTEEDAATLLMKLISQEQEEEPYVYKEGKERIKELRKLQREALKNANKNSSL